ncbi:MAG TPA: hypothetical protein VFV50_00470, partial [Bdellovibrionales bacterium]|nr:hypothetical protein [Bdellovibrionales bacterium]
VKNLVLIALVSILAFTAGLSSAEACRPRPGSTKISPLVKDGRNFGEMVRVYGENGSYGQLGIQLSPENKPVGIELRAVLGLGRDATVSEPLNLTNKGNGFFKVVDVRQATLVDGLQLTFKYRGGHKVVLNLELGGARRGGPVAKGCSGPGYVVRP